MAEPMAVLLIVAHAPLATALRMVGVHAYPEAAERLVAVDVDANEDPQRLKQRLQATLQRHADMPVLMLTDVFGATPCNVAMGLADGQRCRVVTGVNVPMLWRAMCYAGEPLGALVDKALGGATQGVMQVAALRPQHQAPLSNDSDEIDHHHQQ